MKFIIKNLADNPVNFLRRLGYHPSPDGDSLIRRLTSLSYPRLHIYFKQVNPDEWELSLHLDQKRASYQGQRAHSGDYEGEILKIEQQRIISGLELPS